MFKGKPNITLIGAGKIASSLTPALIKSGYKISCIISSNIKSSERLAKKYSIPLYSNNYSGIPAESNFFIISVPDRNILDSVNALSQSQLNFSRSLFIHLSGAEDILLLDKLKKKKASVASFHIMQTFPSRRPIKIAGSCAAIESADYNVYYFLEKFATKLELNPFRIESKFKTLYHLAGVFASNFFAGNMVAAQLLFESAEIKGISFENIITPIIKSTVKNIMNTGPEKSISGPVDRGDFVTVQKHLSYLKKLTAKKGHHFGSYLLQSYISQSLLLLEAVKIKYGALTEGHKKIKDLLLREQKSLW